MNLTILPDSFSIAQVPEMTLIPAEVCKSAFFSVSGTGEGITVVAPEACLKNRNFIISEGWKALMIDGFLDFSMTGVIAGISLVLKEEKIPLFVISVYETDYILVKEADLQPAVSALMREGYGIRTAPAPN
jgi:uncharacterized protein